MIGFGQAKQEYPIYIKACIACVPPQTGPGLEADKCICPPSYIISLHMIQLLLQFYNKTTANKNEFDKGNPTYFLNRIMNGLFAQLNIRLIN